MKNLEMKVDANFNSTSHCSEFSPSTFDLMTSQHSSDVTNTTATLDNCQAGNTSLSPGYINNLRVPTSQSINTHEANTQPNMDPNNQPNMVDPNNQPNMDTNTNVKQCSGCGLSILDRFLLHAMDKFWHTGCLKCACCHAQLGEIGASCFSKSGMILCKNDYIRLFGNTGTCTGCKQSIPAQELVMRAQTHVYHVTCFSCVVCRIRLSRGDRFTVYQGQLLCEHDFPKVMRGSIALPHSAGHRTYNKMC